MLAYVVVDGELGSPVLEVSHVYIAWASVYASGCDEILSVDVEKVGGEAAFRPEPPVTTTTLPLNVSSAAILSQSIIASL